MSWPSLLLMGVLVVVALVLIARIFPASSGTKSVRDLAGMTEALARVRSSTEARAKAAALLAVGDLLVSGGVSPTAATAYYLRAIRLDPTSVAPLERLATALKNRPQALDRVLWKRLSLLPWEGETRAVAARAAELLGGSSSRKRVERHVFTKLAATLRARA